MDEFANTIGIQPRFLKASIALILLAITYQVNPTVGMTLGLLAIVAILTQE